MDRQLRDFIGLAVIWIIVAMIQYGLNNAGAASAAFAVFMLQSWLAYRRFDILEKEKNDAL